MASYKVAYGKRENMNSAIAKGVIPPGCIILTEDSNELFFYDLDKELKSYEERYKFSSVEEANSWVEKYNCQGQIFSIHEEDTCNLYVVGYDNKLKLVSGENYILSDVSPTVDDYQYSLMTHWINNTTDDVYILVSVRESFATWKSITSKSSSDDAPVQSLACIEQSLEAGNLSLSIPIPKGGKYINTSIRDVDGIEVFTDITVVDNIVTISIVESLATPLNVTVAYCI